MAERQVEWVSGRPAPDVRRYVTGYRGYRMQGFEPGVHRGLPSRHMTWIVAIGPSIDVVQQPDGSSVPASYRTVVGGLQASPALITDPGHGAGVEIALTPLGSRSLFGVPARALWNRAYELADVVGSEADELWERLQYPMTWSQRFAVCDEVIGRFDRERLADPGLARAWKSLTASGGSVPIGQLAADLGWSRQHFRRRFVDEFGTSPKVAARIVRFERATTMLRSVPSFVSIAQVAATCGYYDQAHLDRDFAEFAGCSPSRWMSDETVPFFQDDPPDDVRSSDP